MTVDLSKLKKGDEVEFRCAGKAIVDGVGSLLDGVTVWFGDQFVVYEGSGTVRSTKDSPFDIIAIHSKFDWADVKPGTPVKYVGKTAWFLCEDPSNPDYCVISRSRCEQEGFTSPQFILKSDITEEVE